MNRTVIALTLSVAFAITGCSADEVANPGGQVSTDDLAVGSTVQVTADASRVAATLDGSRTETGYPAAAPQVALTGANTLVGYQATETTYTFCVVEPKTGAWAFYDSTAGGLTGSGNSGQTCAAN